MGGGRGRLVLASEKQGRHYCGVLLPAFQVTWRAAVPSTSLRSREAISLQTHIHNAVLAGGVAMGIPCYLIHSPWLAMVLGFIAGLISIGGAKILLVRSWAANTCCLGLHQGPGPWDHGGPLCNAMGCLRQLLAPFQFGFRSWVRE